MVVRRLERLRAMLDEVGVGMPCSSSSEGTSTSPLTPAADWSDSVLVKQIRGTFCEETVDAR